MKLSRLLKIKLSVFEGRPMTHLLMDEIRVACRYELEVLWGKGLVERNIPFTLTVNKEDRWVNINIRDMELPDDI